jgi:pullulanase
VQLLALATVAFSQGVAYFHAGTEMLRSKSLDGNSYDSGDWFNRLDWTYQTNHFGTGLPPAGDNQALWTLAAPRLADARLRPAPADIAFVRDGFLDLLRIRASSSLFRLTTADAVQQRLTAWRLHPVQAVSSAGDPRVPQQVRHDATSLQVPALSAVVFVR